MQLEAIRAIMASVEGNFDELEGDYPLEIIDEGNWVDNGKYDNLEDFIIQDTETDKYYVVVLSRAGNYYSDYEIYYQGVYPVKPKEVTKVVWEIIKED